MCHPWKSTLSMYTSTQYLKFSTVCLVKKKLRFFLKNWSVKLTFMCPPPLRLYRTKNQLNYIRYRPFWSGGNSALISNDCFAAAAELQSNVSDLCLPSPFLYTSQILFLFSLPLYLCLFAVYFPFLTHKKSFKSVLNIFKMETIITHHFTFPLYSLLLTTFLRYIAVHSVQLKSYDNKHV